MAHPSVTGKIAFFMHGEYFAAYEFRSRYHRNVLIGNFMMKIHQLHAEGEDNYYEIMINKIWGATGHQENLNW